MVAALLGPRAVVPDLMALAAFAAELASIPSTVSDPLLGEIRLQWWRDAIGSVAAGERTGHPVADAFGKAIERHRLDLPGVHRMIDARAFDLAGDLHADDAALEAYFTDTEGIPFALAAAILGAPNFNDELPITLGLSYGLARALGRLPALLHNGGFPIPAARLEAAGVAPRALSETAIAPETAAAIERAARALESLALDAAERARARLRAADHRTRLAALPLAMIEPYFAAQKRTGFRRIEHVATVLPLTRVWRLGLAQLRGRV